MCGSSPLPPEQPTTVHPSIFHLNLSPMPIFSYTFILQPIHKLSPLNSIMTCTVVFICFKVNPLSFRAFLIPSIHKLFGLPLPHLPSTPDSYTLFAILSSFIRSTCPNYLKAHLSDLISNSHTTYTSQIFNFHEILSNLYVCISVTFPSIFAVVRTQIKVFV